jgi:peptidyl-tRNA hydrolase
MINAPNEPSDTHKKSLREKIMDEVIERFMEKKLDTIKKNVEDALKKFQDTTNKELEKTQKKLNKLREDFNKH